MKFDYFYGSQADQFSFIRIPRMLIKDPRFSPLSVYAKMLYAVLLDRMSLSSKNGWFDEDNRVYIIYPTLEVQEDLGIGKKKALEVMTELVEFGLLEKKRRGLGLPNLLYLKSFLSESADQDTSDTETGNALKFQTGTSGSIHTGTSKGIRKEPAEVPEPAPHGNKYKYNNTYRNQIVSNHIQAEDLETAGVEKQKRYDTDPAISPERLRDLICENIRYADLMITHRLDKDMIDGMVDLIQETIMTDGEYVLIASNRYPARVVRSKFLKLGYEHICYVLDCLKSNTTKVKNIRKYLLAVLFNATSTMNGYYQAEVNHDLPQYAS